MNTFDKHWERACELFAEANEILFHSRMIGGLGKVYEAEGSALVALGIKMQAQAKEMERISAEIYADNRRIFSEQVLSVFPGMQITFTESWPDDFLTCTLGNGEEYHYEQ